MERVRFAIQAGLPVAQISGDLNRLAVFAVCRLAAPSLLLGGQVSSPSWNSPCHYVLVQLYGRHVLCLHQARSFPASGPTELMCLSGDGLQAVQQAVETYLQNQIEQAKDGILCCHLVLDSLDCMLQHTKLNEVRKMQCGCGHTQLFLCSLISSQIWLSCCQRLSVW